MLPAPLNCLSPCELTQGLEVRLRKNPRLILGQFQQTAYGANKDRIAVNSGRT